MYLKKTNNVIYLILLILYCLFVFLLSFFQKAKEQGIAHLRVVVKGLGIGRLVSGTDSLSMLTKSNVFYGPILHNTLD